MTAAEAPAGTAQLPPADGRGPTVVVVTAVAITHEVFLLPHAAAIAAEGYRVVGVGNGLHRSEAAIAAYDAVYDLPLGRHAKPGPLTRSGLALRRIVKEEDAAVVWFHTPLAAAVGRLVLAPMRRQGLQIAYMAHGFHFGSYSDAPVTKVYHAVEWALSPTTDLLQTLTQEDYELALGLPRRTPANTVFTNGVGIDLKRFEASPERRASARADLGLSDGDVAVFTVGEMKPDKRIDEALRAVADLDPKVHLFVVGDGAERDRIEQVAAGLPGRPPRFLGFRKDVPDLLQAADVLLHPASREGLPTVVLEAQASGVPVVGTASRGTADLLVDGAGITVPVGDIAAMRASVRRLIDDAALRESVIAAGLRRAAHHGVDEAVESARAVARLAAPARRAAG